MSSLRHLLLLTAFPGMFPAARAAPDATKVPLQRCGAAPELTRVTFETGAASGQVRAREVTSGGLIASFCLSQS